MPIDLVEHLEPLLVPQRGPFIVTQQGRLDFHCGEHCLPVVRDAGHFHFAPVEFPAAGLREILRELETCPPAFEPARAFAFGGGGAVEFKMVWIVVVEAKAERERRGEVALQRGVIAAGTSHLSDGGTCAT